MSKTGSETGGSRLPVTNSTDPRRLRLTTRSGVELRRECENPAVDRGATAVTWETARERWATYIEETRNTELAFERVDAGGNGKFYRDRSHRWSPAYQEQRYAKMKDMERGIGEFYDDPWTGLLTFTASSDQVSAPVDHTNDLLEGRAAALEALRRSLDGRTWDYWWVLEPHESGYLHLHLAVIVEGAITERQLRPAVEAHLRNCEPAGREAHEEAVEVTHGREISNLAAYLNAYLGDYESDPLEAPEEVQAANAVLWATQRRETGASRRLRQFMKGEEPEPEGEWQLTAVVDPDGEERPVDPEVPGGVETVTTEVRWGDSPPPDRGKRTGIR